MPGPFRVAILILPAVLLSFMPGCNEPAEAPSLSSPIRQIDTAGLPALGDYAPPVDGGRLEIAGPDGWQLASRASGYAVRFRAGSDDPYPMILVKVEDSSTQQLTAENVVAFASSLSSDGSAQPTAVGERIGVLQRKRGKDPNTVDQILERLIFTTVLGGRSYAVELRTRQDRIEEHQNTLFAVVAGMRAANAGSGESADGEVSSERKEAGEEATRDAGQKELEEIFR
ncbi:MAG: hypothetical protein GXX96_12670 [Planctomycetaceae bacterium]|nr:hypothetical protein [Planctomycetaceae bacterium]